jgi:hypothetical protein
MSLLFPIGIIENMEYKTRSSLLSFPQAILCVSDPYIDIADAHDNKSLVGSSISPLPCEIELSTEGGRYYSIECARRLADDFNLIVSFSLLF